MGILKSFAALILLSSLCACGLTHSLWGEKSPGRQTVEMQGDSNPSFQEIFSAEDRESLRVLAIWRKSINDTFQQIEGKQKDYLSVAEITVLVKKGFVHLADDQATSIARTQAILRLLGHQDGISLTDVNTLFDWFDRNRTQARTFYRLFVSDDPLNKQWAAIDLIKLLQLFGSFIELGGPDSLTASQLNDLLQPFIGNDHPHAKAGLQSGVGMSIAFFSSLCGDRVEAQDWNGKKIGLCIRDLVDHFEPTAPVFDFIFGNLNPFSHRQELSEANTHFSALVSSWLKGHHHPAFATQTILDFSKALSIPPPYQFFKLMDWIPKLNTDSTATQFSPSFFIDVAKVLQNWVNTVLTQTQAVDCNQENWKTCAYLGDFDPVVKLYSAEYSTLIRTRDLSLLNKLALYQSMAKFLMSSLDQTHSGSLTNGIQQLITITIRLMDSNNFAYNILHQIEEKPISDSNAEAAIQNLRFSGLAEVIAFASDIIPARGQVKTLFLKRIGENVDELGITTFLYLYDLLGNMRDDYFSHYDLPQTPWGDTTFVKRRKLMESLPRLLADHFPRTYQSCVDWGFERSCGIVFSEVLPTPDVRPAPFNDSLEPYEMDIVSITGILIESMMNRCNATSEGNVRDTSCIVNLSQALVDRLMNSQMIKSDSLTKFLIDSVRNIAFFRWSGKMALAKGTLKGLGIRVIPPFSIFSGSASVGSILSLASELMNEDKTRAVENGTIGPIEKAGDELLYENQFTLHFLPDSSFKR